MSMEFLRKYRGWVMAASLAAVLLAVLVLGMSYASAQTATPAATGTAEATTAATGTATADASPTTAATSAATAAASPTGAATGAATGTAAPTGAATTAATRTATAVATAAATAVGTPRATATVTASLQISLPQQSYLPLDLALQAATAALEECEDQGYRVAVTVVDQAGVEKVVLKGDRAGPHTLGSSFKKAFTAASLGSVTAGLVDRVTKDPTLEGLASMDERILLLGGGLPIRVNDEIVGGIGVGGAPSGLIDETCAQAGLDSLEE
jgi:uncharacterized protein GlcG (DUF336 family)